MQTQIFNRFFLVPGMDHGAGNGPGCREWTRVPGMVLNGPWCREVYSKSVQNRHYKTGLQKLCHKIIYFCNLLIFNKLASEKAVYFFGKMFAVYEAPTSKHMKKENTTPAPDYSGIIQKLKSFVDQRPVFNMDNYFSPYDNLEQRKQGLKCYRNDYSEALKDKHSFYELLALALNFVTYKELEETLFLYLQRNSGRLTLDENNNLDYCTGQYFPTEYRAAACRILAGLLWDIVRNLNPQFTGTEIRKFITKRLRTNNSKLYFN